MRELQQALLPVKRRLRAQRAFQWAAIGALAAAGGVALLRMATFLWPLPAALAWGLALLVGLPALCALTAASWPVADLDAARQADALGLMARAQTALMLQDDDTPMASLQRRDAIESLKGLEPRRVMHLHMPGAVWMAIAVCLGLTALSFLIPNPQVELLRAQEQFRREMAAQAETIDQSAATMDQSQAEAPETRKLLSELSQNLRRAENKRDALEAVDQAERKLTRMQQRTAENALNALKSAGLAGLASALENHNAQQAQSLLEGDEAARQLSEAAQQAEGQAAELLDEAAQALNVGDLQKALELLQSAASGQSALSAQAAALAAMARSAAAKGSLSAQGQKGQGENGVSAAQGKGGSGGGASLGSSDGDGGKTQNGQSASAQGKAPPVKKVADYETIYDPTRLGGSGDSFSETGEMGQGVITEAQMGTGAGSLEGSVPYGQALPEYSQAAVQAAQNAALPAYAQKWVQDYFTLLQQ